MLWRIKERETSIDKYRDILGKENITSEEMGLIKDNLEELSHEMMAMNT